MTRAPLGLRRKLQRLRSAKWVSVASISALALLAAGALAYWTGLGAMLASATVGTLTTPSITGAVVAPESVTLSWTPVSPPGAGTVTYYVLRDGLPPSGGCPNSGAPSTATSCVDAPVPDGTHTYTVTALWRTWTARSEQKTVVVSSGVATHFVLEAASVTPTAGEADNLTVVAKDASNNTVANYNGEHTLVFGGSSAAPNGILPTVSNEAGAAVPFGQATNVKFFGGKAVVSGTTNGVMRLYRAGEAHITVAEGSLNNGAGLALTVKPGAFKSFGVTPAPAEPQAGQAFEAKLAAWDEFHNVLTTYTRTRKLLYSGAEAAPSGKAPEYSTTSEPTFSAGEATLTGFHFYKAATTTLKVTEEGSGHEGSASFTVKAAPAKTLALAAAASEVGSGVPDNLTITALDEFQNVATGYGAGGGETKSLTFEGAGVAPNGSEATVANESGTATKFAQATAIRFVAGKASVSGTANGVMTLYKVEEAHIKVKEGTLSNGTGLAIKVIAGPAKSFRLAAPAPAEPEAGQAFNVTITALDAGGNVATSYGGAGGQNKTLAYFGPASSPSGKAPEYPGSATTVNFREGVGTATAIKLYHAGSNTLTAKEGTIEGSVAFNVKAGAIASFKLSAPVPAEPEAGQALSVTLTAIDTYGNTATSYGGAAGQNKPIAYSGPESSPSGKAPEYPGTATTVNFREGVGTATAIKLYHAGATTLVAREGAHEGSTTFTVKPGAGKSFVVTPAPAEPEAGQAFQVKLTALDEFHNVVTNYTRANKLVYSGAETSANGKAPEYSATTEPTFSGGEATLTGFRFYKAASTTLKVREEVSGREGQATFTVKTGPAASFELAAPAPTEPEVGQALNVTITALDAGGNVATSYGGAAGQNKTLAYFGPASSPSGKAPEYPGTATTVNFREGVGTATAIKLYHAGANTLTAKEGAIEGAVAFNVKAGAAASLSLSFNPAEALVGVGEELTIRALDAYGNVATSYANGAHSLTFSGPANGLNGTRPYVLDRNGRERHLGNRTSINFTAGEATVTAGRNGVMMLFRPEEAHIRVTSGRLSNGTNGQAIKVGIGPPRSFRVSAPSPAEPEAGQAFNVTLTALDAGGDVVTSYGGAAGQSKTIEYSGPEASPSGIAPEYPGSATTVNFREGVGTATGIKLYRAAETTLSASEGAITGATGFNVKTGAFKDFGVTPAPEEPQAGQAFNATITAWDQFENPITNYTPTHRLRYEGAESSASGRAPEYSTNTQPTFEEGQATVTGFRFYKSGPTTLEVSEETTGHEGSGSFNVAAGAFRRFNVTPVEGRSSLPGIAFPGLAFSGLARPLLEGTPFQPTAGKAFEARIAAWDEWDNPILTFTRTRALRYTGAESSPGGFAPEYSTTTEPTFNGGETTVAGFRFYKAASTTLAVSEGGREGSGTFTVKPASATSLSLAFNPAEATAGTGDELTVKALDPYGNLASTSYANGVHTLTFGGAANGATGAEPRVTDRTGAAKPFGQPTEIEFSGAEAHVEAGRNGLMTLYSAEEAHVTVTDGSLKNGVSGQPIKVKGGEARSFRVSGPAPAEPEAGQAFNVTITALDAGGNVATSYGGAGGQNKTLAYSGPASSPSGKAPEYPGSATTVNFREGVGTATAIKLYHAGSNTLTAKEGTIEGSSIFNVKPAAAASFKLSAPVPAEPEAGQALSVTITALDSFGNTATSYGGAIGQGKVIAYSGPESSPSGKTPEYPASATTVTFHEGLGTATGIKLYRAGATTLVAREGTHEGSTSFSVRAGAYKSLGVTPIPAEPQAGQAFEAKLTAYDEFHNVVTNYVRANKLVYSGAETSANGKAPEYSSTTEPTFSAGEATLTGFRFYKAAATTLKAREEVSGHEGQATFTVKAGPAASFRLAAPAPAEPEVSQAFNVTITALDAGGNVATSYGGAGGQNKTLAYSGPASSPSGKAPEYPGSATTVNFREGVGTATAIKLYHAGSNTLTASEGTVEGAVALTVKPGAFKSFGVTPAPAEPQAGQAFEAKLAAWDEFHNVLTTYTRTRKLLYSGAEAAPSGKAPEYSTTSEPTFSAGEATLTGFHFYKAATTTLKVTEEGSGHEGSASFTVKAAPAKTLALAAAASEVGSGVPDNLTITALDEFQNVATGYGAGGGETKSLTFEGAGVAPNGSEATVANESGTATKFAQATAIRFVAGKASVSGTANGVMTLYKVEEAHIKVKEGTLSNGTGLAIKVIAGPAKSFRLAAPAPAEPEVSQAFNVTITALDAGGNVATSYGGAGGQNKTLAYSGPASSPSGKAPEYPGSATTVNFREGVGTATAIKLYHAGSNTLTAKEGTIEGSVAFNVKAGAAKHLEWVEPQTVPAGKIVSATCLFECTVEGVGNEGQFSAKVGIGDEWGNLQASHGTGTVNVELSATGPGGTFSPTAVTIAAGATNSAAFTFTARRAPFRNTLRAQAPGYTAATALVSN